MWFYPGRVNDEGSEQPTFCEPRQLRKATAARTVSLCVGGFALVDACVGGAKACLDLKSEADLFDQCACRVRGRWARGPSGTTIPRL